MYNILTYLRTIVMPPEIMLNLDSIINYLLNLYDKYDSEHGATVCHINQIFNTIDIF